MPLVSLLPHYIIDLQLQLCSALKTAFSWEQSIVLKAKEIANIKWWKHCELILLSAPISGLQPTITSSTDASNSGWGGALSSGPTASAPWSEQESQHHINYLELKAIKLCILSFLDHLKDNYQTFVR